MSSKLTVFGRITRKLRVEHDEYLRDMAMHLGVTPAYLSAVERGQRNPPYEWVGLLQEAYDLPFSSAEYIKKAMTESRIYNKLDISHLDDDDKRLIETVVEYLPMFDDAKRETLYSLTGQRKRG
ncbi:helix-turn-helix transcriptional regulator [Salipaludibacillus agaradhaerens]|jgi:transcriptional regulator with XRE-family HTH domain|uniref:helix-turn-helix domain-containing protein n=1 Tax=Salipaludibacillus agaradhaerens TaxID=76935 RepID=UPI002151D45E|nr:helix-turn-helix transcriptional regulator [Salipaludibacillus agaradhaerens]MCR6108724.1 helix-turn-helix transcriptional regulator [Salipaludibacillus agaradhaerens]MCR6120747.1 helix-turn-helix transcriptional regulator [Salipaludibacillus agaradhaerens]